jgi:hypothetical protein
MLQVVDLKVRTLDVDYHQVSWRIADTQEDVFDYTFQLLRSESSAGPWEVVSATFQDQYLFFDRIQQPFHTARLFHYLLRVVNQVTNDTVTFGPVDMQPEADLVAAELRRHMNLLFHEFTGRRCWVLPIRTFGQRCSCWNPVLQKRKRSGCPLCFDTGFVRGYMHPIETWVQIDPGSNQAEQQSNVGTLQQMNTTGRVSDIGIVKPRDVIIEAENKRWRVTQINQTEQSRAPVHLELTMHLIPPSDIEYAIPLKLDKALKDLYISPPRNFTNPQNLSDFENEKFPDIFNLYSGGQR